MSRFDVISKLFASNGWFQEPGAYVLVDGQYGSTGKGALAALIAATCRDQIDVVTTNAGPNSGHTGYLPMQWMNDPPLPGEVEAAARFDDCIVTRQLPVLGVAAQALFKKPPLIYLNGGAVIDPDVLRSEVSHYLPLNEGRFWIHPCAAIIDGECREDSLDAIASTGKGVGAAIARKVMRNANVACYFPQSLWPAQIQEFEWDWSKHRVFVETAQGFSLGINSSFYPFTTSRECTVMQAIADARIPYNKVRKVIMTVRTYPIRVGNTDKGYSGDFYPDQRETTWADIGVTPELTTVTKRVRRVFTWSRQQFHEAVAANQPDAIFLSFVDYLRGADAVVGFMHQLLQDYRYVMGRYPEFVLQAVGPRPEDVGFWQRGVDYD